MVTVLEFDNWYDEQIEKAIAKLPDPNKCNSPTVQYPITFDDLTPFELSPTMFDSVTIYCIEFKKVRHSERGLIWIKS